jgi:uncharacterized protein (DUF1697 family)
MPRHVAFLRGVSPVSLQMSDLRACLERAGFDAVRTVLASGNVAFDVAHGEPAALEQRLESAMALHLGRSFHTIVRPVATLEALLSTTPFAGYGLPDGAKRVVSFLRGPRPPRCALPLTEGMATVIHQIGAEVFTAYLPGAEGPVFMKLIERAYGHDVTTRTWETVARCAAA